MEDRERHWSRVWLPRGCLAATGIAIFTHLVLLDDNEHYADADEIIFQADDPPRDHSAWVISWLGMYRTAGIHAGRPFFEALSEPDKILWFASDRNYWHFGHPHDIKEGAAMIASQDAAAARPDEVDTASYPWRAVVGAGRWLSEPSLRCVRAPPRRLYLSGHAQSRWVADWLGAYERQTDEMVNGWPSYRRVRCRHGVGPCAQRLWLVSSHGERVWAIGDAAFGDSASAFVLSVRAELPHATDATWTIADDAGGWQPAPALRCTASAAHAVGWYRSFAEAWPDPRMSKVHIRISIFAVATAADTWFDFTARLREMLAIFSTSYLTEAAIFRYLVECRQAAAREMWARSSAATDAFVRMDPYESAAFTSALWIGLLALATLAQRSGHARRLSLFLPFFATAWVGDEADDDAEGEVEAAEAADSSEEKRLAFACLSGAIEEVKESISEQQYLELYSAARWCFNLTPWWAGTVPRPPSPTPTLGEAAPRDEGASGEPAARVVARLVLDVQPSTSPRGASGGGGCGVRVAAHITAARCR